MNYRSFDSLCLSRNTAFSTSSGRWIKRDFEKDFIKERIDRHVVSRPFSFSYSEKFQITYLNEIFAISSSVCAFEIQNVVLTIIFMSVGERERDENRFNFP